MSTEPATLEMTITPFIENELKQWPFLLEVEMLRGYRRELPDGRIEYKIEISDPEKQELVMEFCLKMISHSHLQNGN